jgi:hypothetical protein
MSSFVPPVLLTVVPRYIEPSTSSTSFLLMVIAWLLLDNTGIRWKMTTKLDELDFADDIALLSSSKDHMQNKLNSLKDFNSVNFMVAVLTQFLLHEIVYQIKRNIQNFIFLLYCDTFSAGNC